MKKRINIYYILIAAAAAVYLFLTFNTPSNPASMERYQLTEQGIFFLRISFILPILFIWFAGTYAFTVLTKYTELVKGTWEEEAFKKMRLGIGILFWVGLVASSLTNTIGSYIGGGVSNYPLRPFFVILSNYFSVLPTLLGFFFIFLSARIFLSHTKAPSQISLAWKAVMGASLAIVAYVCLELIFSDPYRSIPAPNGRATYYIDDSLLILTVIIPLLLSWVIGLLATKKLGIYTRVVEGKIYKDFFSNLSLGLNSLILLSIFLRALTSVGTSRIAELGFTSIIFLIYLIFFVIGIAYVFIARGVSKLSKIESI